MFVAAGLVGGLVGVIFGVMEKLENRVASLERRPYTAASSSDAIREMQRTSARHFAEALREQGLIVTTYNDPGLRKITDSPQA